VALPGPFRLGNAREPRFKRGFPHASKKIAFFQPFLRFFLAFSVFLGYSPLRPEFFTEKQGVASSAPASIASEWKDKSGG
jgi:hypothetical protein